MRLGEMKSMSNFHEHLEELMRDEAFREEYEQMQPEFEVMRALIDARTKMNMTQKELAKRSGVKQSNISRIEKGNNSPNITTLKKLAEGLGLRLQIKFVPKNTYHN